MQSFRLRVSATEAGKNVKMKVFRDGTTKTLNVKIGDYPEETVAGTVPEQENVSLGLSVIDVTDPRARQYNLQSSTGVLITGVEPNSPADEAGLRPGDIVLAIEKHRIEDVEAYQRLTKQLHEGTPVIFHVQRGERKLYVALTP
jgi:serine protease Do